MNSKKLWRHRHRREKKTQGLVFLAWLVLTVLLLALLGQRLPNSIFWLPKHTLILSIAILSILLYFRFRSLVQHRFSLDYALSHALKHNHFQAVYQPVLDHSRNQFCGAEVLLRWQTSTNEIIMPDGFITEAESSGLIIPISLQLIDSTFEQCKNLLACNPQFFLAFNLSAAHFKDKDFFNIFYELCAEYEIPANQLMIEFTERQLLNSEDKKMIKVMHELRERGISLAIDDFGTGHASINYLQHFPFNYLKIDQIFVQAIGSGAITETLNHAIIEMAQRLGLTIIAEGVETAEQMDFLVNKKVNFLQGWYFAKAMSFAELEKVIEA